MSGPGAKPLAIVNPQSRSGRTGRNWQRIQNRIEQAIGPIDAWMTDRQGAATELTARGLDEGRTWIIAVGGDGTLNEVVNGFIRDDRPIQPEACLSFVMRGTGNDFRRTVSESRSLAGDIQALANGTARPMDLGKLTYTAHDGSQKVRYFDNLASFGMGGAVDMRVNASSLGRYLGGTAAFLWATVQTLATYRNQMVRLTLDNDPSLERTVRLVAVGNGQFAGGGMKFTPNARIDDGLFDVVILGDISLPGVIRNMLHLYRGTHIGQDKIEAFRCSALRAESDVEVLLDVDGEAPGRLPATFEILPGIIRLKV